MQLSLPLPDIILSDETLRVPRPRRVYVNRSLRFDRVPMVGFDMDYTLIIYRQQQMDRLSIEATAKELVDRRRHVVRVHPPAEEREHAGALVEVGEGLEVTHQPWLVERG